jgi:hypothetical protein
MPLGALLAGVAAAAVGARLTIAVGGAVTLVCAAAIVVAIPSLRKLE